MWFKNLHTRNGEEGIDDLFIFQILEIKKDLVVTISVIGCHYFALDINECHSDPCMNSGTCTDKVNGYECSCSDGYTGTHCETGMYKKNDFKTTRMESDARGNVFVVPIYLMYLGTMVSNCSVIRQLYLLQTSMSVTVTHVKIVVLVQTK